MTDADKLRDILEQTDCSRGQWEPLLDSLEAERDAWSDAHNAAQEQVIVNHRRAEAAESNAQVFHDEWDKALAERDAWKVEALHHNAEEIRLREALEAVAAQQPKTLKR